VQVFESEMKRANRFIGSVFSPIGTKDFSTYITKIRQAGVDALYIVMAGDDFNAFLAQAAQYRLPEKVQLLTEQMELTLLRAVGDAALGLIGSTRYCFTLDFPANRDFVALWQKEHAVVPDTFEGEQWQACQILAAGIEKANSTEIAALRDALETVAIDSIKGHVAIRKCDHQAVQSGFMVKAAKRDGISHPTPEVIATYPGDKTTPPCNKMTFED
jgi:branched-chain amino acid transport system substrate-binding protein